MLPAGAGSDFAPGHAALSGRSSPPALSLHRPTPEQLNQSMEQPGFKCSSVEFSADLLCGGLLLQDALNLEWHAVFCAP